MQKIIFPVIASILILGIATSASLVFAGAPAPIQVSVAQPVVVIPEGDGGKSFIFTTLILDRTPTEDLSFSLTGIDGTAESPTDYRERPFIISAGVMSPVNIAIGEVFGDTTPEPDETLSIILDSCSPGCAIDPANDTVDVTIENDDVSATISFVQSSSIVDEDVGTHDISVQLHTFGGPIPEDASVYVVDLLVPSATSGDDYNEFPDQFVNFIEGSPDGTIIDVSLTIVNDENDEEPETVQLQLQGPTVTTIVAPDTHEITINDNDEPILVSVAEPIVVIPEGDGGKSFIFTSFILDRTPTTDLNVSFISVDGTAESPTDYRVRPLFIGAGTTSPVNVVIGEVFGDTTPEPDETLSIILDSCSPGCAIDPANDTVDVTIENDDVSNFDITPDNFNANAFPGETLMLDLTFEFPFENGDNVIGLVEVEDCDDAIGLSGDTEPIDGTSNTVSGVLTITIASDAEIGSYHCENQFSVKDSEFNLLSEIVILDIWITINEEDVIEALIIEVDDLGLNKGHEKSLTKKLDNALTNITNEDPTDDSEACEKLQSFIDQLNAFVKTGKIDDSDAQPLIDQTNELIEDFCENT